MKNSLSTHPGGSAGCKTARNGGDSAVAAPGRSTVGTHENPTIPGRLPDAEPIDVAASFGMSNPMDRHTRRAMKAADAQDAVDLAWRFILMTRSPCPVQESRGRRYRLRSRPG